MRKIPLFASCAILALAALAGCGSGNGQAETPATQAETAAQAETQAAQTETPAAGPASEAAAETAGTAEQGSADGAEVTLPGVRAYPLPDDYEIHLLLDPEKALDENHEPTKAVIDAFGAGEKKVKTYGVVYMDTPRKDFWSEGWINRLRLREDKPGKEVQFVSKKRYPISGEDIHAALQLAASEGFDVSDDTWDVQVEYGYEKMTLSISMEQDLPGPELARMADLTAEDAAALCGEFMPDQERDWKTAGWGTDAIRESRMAGPVSFRRYTGTFRDEEVKLEIWTIPGGQTGTERCIAELSCEADSLEEAALYRSELENTLSALNVFLPGDALKTGQILDAFLGE